MAQFGDRIQAIRAAAQAVAPADSFVVTSDNLSHLGNGTFAVSLKVERETEILDQDPDTDPYNKTLASIIVRWDDDVSEVGERLLAALNRKADV